LPISEETTRKALKKVFRTTVEITMHFDLTGGKLIAHDSSGPMNSLSFIIKVIIPDQS
jgi:hypothetical protein